ncbi:MAG: hypothetical protein ACPGSL_08440 [Vicingaceae bacterium]
MFKESSIIKLNHSEIELKEDNIVEVITFDKVNLCVKKCLEIHDAYDQMLEKDKKYRILYLPGKYVDWEKEARECCATEEATKHSLAEAIVVHSLAQRLLVNFYLKINKPLVPTKLFRNKVSAKKWLMSF